MPSFMLPAKPGTCPICAVDHDSTFPHNVQSLCYQYAFYGTFNRWPNWWDAAAHCEPALREKWFETAKATFPNLVKDADFLPPPAADVVDLVKQILAWEASIKPGQTIATPNLLKPTVMRATRRPARAR